MWFKNPEQNCKILHPSGLRIHTNYDDQEIGCLCMNGASVHALLIDITLHSFPFSLFLNEEEGNGLSLAGTSHNQCNLAIYNVKHLY